MVEMIKLVNTAGPCWTGLQCLRGCSCSVGTVLQCKGQQLHLSHTVSRFLHTLQLRPRHQYGDPKQLLPRSCSIRLHKRCSNSRSDQGRPRWFVCAASDLATEVPATASKEAKGRLVLIDAMSLAFRAHFAFKAHRLKTSSGEDTSVPFGFFNMLFTLLEEQQTPTHVAAVFDAAGKNFRHEMYREYKAGRPPMPDEMKAGIPTVKRLLDLMGIRQLAVPGVEADDVVGTLAARGAQAGMDVVIASDDKDFQQLLQPGVSICRPVRKGAGGLPPAAVAKGAMVLLTDAGFREQMGLAPGQWLDYRALMGDPSDNIPGVKGIGEKGAVALLKEHGTLEGLLERAGEVKRKAHRETLQSEEGRASALLAKRLMTIQTDLNLPPLKNLDLEQLRLRMPEDQGVGVREAFEALEFKTHVKRVQAFYDELRQR